MGFLSEKDRTAVQTKLRRLSRPVKLLVFTQEMECGFCKDTRELVEEVAALSDLISVEVKDFVKDEEAARGMGIDKIPAIAVLGEGDRDYGIRFFGIPSGYEFISLLESLELASRGDSGLAPQTREKLRNLKKPLSLQVFVTPTCPYCPRAVVLAFRLAVESPQITAAMVEASEFSFLANRYNVSGVPHTVIGDSPQPMIGAYPEHAALELVLAAVGE
jgi:glutaredoxin-like protein